MSSIRAPPRCQRRVYDVYVENDDDDDGGGGSGGGVDFAVHRTVSRSLPSLNRQRASLFFYLNRWSPPRLTVAMLSLLYAAGPYFDKIYIVSRDHYTTLDLNGLENVCQQLTNEDDKANRLTRNYQYFLIQSVSPNISHYSVGLWQEGDNSSYRKIRERNIHVEYVTVRASMTAHKCMQFLKSRKDYFYRATGGAQPESCIVFDLDETLIDGEYRLLSPLVATVLADARHRFDRVLMWTHGNTEHMNQAFKLHSTVFDFDLYISRSNTAPKCFNKGLGLVLRKLNQSYGTTELSISVLVDDTRTNYNQDYDYFIYIPRKLTTPDACFEALLTQMHDITERFQQQQLQYDYPITATDSINSNETVTVDDSSNIAVDPVYVWRRSNIRTRNGRMAASTVGPSATARHPTYLRRR